MEKQGKKFSEILRNGELPWKNYGVVCGGEFPASAHCFCLNLFHSGPPKSLYGEARHGGTDGVQNCGTWQWDKGKIPTAPNSQTSQSKVP